MKLRVPRGADQRGTVSSRGQSRVERRGGVLFLFGSFRFFVVELLSGTTFFKLRERGTEGRKGEAESYKKKRPEGVFGAIPARCVEGTEFPFSCRMPAVPMNFWC